MKKLLSILMLLVAIVTGAKAASGDVLFSQDFNSATAVAYTNGTATSITTSSGNNIVGTTATSQFSFIGITNKNSAGIAINSPTGGNSTSAEGIFRAYCNATGQNWAIVHNTGFATTAPTALKISMKIHFTQLSSGSDYSVSFAIGDGIENVTGGPDAGNVHSGFSIINNSTPKLTQYKTKTAIYTTGIAHATWQNITWVINNTGDVLEYDDPNGGRTTVNNDCFDLWVGTTKAVTNQAATTAAKTLQNLYIGDPAGKKNCFQLDDLVVTDLTPGEAPSGKTATTTTITADSKASLDLAINHGTSAGTLAATVVDAESASVEGATVSWESSDESVATINADGEVTLVATGTTTLKATYAGSEKYDGSNDSYEITVTDTRTDLAGAWSANPTFDKNEENPTIPTFAVTGGGTEGTDYTVAYSVVSDENSILTVDANDGITAINTANPGIATVKATITVVNTAEYKAATTEYTCTVTVNNVLEAVSDYTWDFTDATEFTDAASADHTYTAETYVNNVMIGNGAQLMKKTGDADNQIQRLKLNQQGSESGYYVKIKVAAHSKVTVNTVGGSSRKIYFAENQVGGTKLAELDCGSARGDKVLEDSGEGEKVICIYNSASGNITLYSIKVEPIASEITLSNTDGKTKGFATFCSSTRNFTVSGATAYKAAITENKIVLTAVGNDDAVIPAEAGIIIAGEKGAAATVTYTDDEVTANMDGNSLAGTTARVATSTLKADDTDKVVGFFKSSSAFKSYTGEFFPANLAYFVIPASSATQSFDIVFDGETAINSIDANDNANSAAPVKVIKNGKLYIGNYNVAGQQVK